MTENTIQLKHVRTFSHIYFLHTLQTALSISDINLSKMFTGMLKLKHKCQILLTQPTTRAYVYFVLKKKNVSAYFHFKTKLKMNSIIKVQPLFEKLSTHLTLDNVNEIHLQLNSINWSEIPNFSVHRFQDFYLHCLIRQVDQVNTTYVYRNNLNRWGGCGWSNAPP